MKYRPDIDGLRAIAVLLVLVFHFDLFSAGKAGFIGVDVFFVISGFLITTIISEDLRAGQFHFGRFLYRRVRRLYPALVSTLLLTMVAGYFLFLPPQYRELAVETLWSLLYIVNFYFWQNVNYFGLHVREAPLLHLWSLAIEEQFYILFPVALIIINKFMRRALVPVIILALMASFALSFMFTPLKPEASFYLLPTRAWELLAGAVLSTVLRERSPAGFWLHIMGPLGLGLIALSILLYSPLTQFPGWFALLPVLGAAAIIIGGYQPMAPVTRFLSAAPIVWVGRISYPLYLVHWPIKIFLQAHLFEFTLGWRILGFASSVGVAALIYTFIEVPLRRGRVLAGRRPYISAMAAASAAMLAVSITLIRNDGAPTRFVPEVSRLLAYAEDTPDIYRACEFTEKAPPSEEICRLGNKASPTMVLVLGDSHALAFAGAISTWLEHQGKGGLLAFHHGCMPVVGAGREKCLRYASAAIDLAVSRPNLDEVVLVSIWRQALPVGGKPFDGRWVPATEVPEIFAAHLSRTIHRLTAAGLRVSLVEPFFAAANPVPETWAGNLAFGRDWPVAISLRDHEKEFATVFDTFDKVEGPNVRRISLIDDFCSSGLCVPIINGRPLFIDDNHLAFSHSRLLADIFSRKAPIWNKVPRSGKGLTQSHFPFYP